MDAYITGNAIKQFREAKSFTQSELADRIGVTAKAVSKWETGKGLPDITLIEPLAKALSVSVMELMNGKAIVNRNVSGNMLRSKFYVCPICGNIIHSMGDISISCCGISLPALEYDDADESHDIKIENVEDEHFLSIDHAMTKTHYISFIAHVSYEKRQLVKLYPEGDAQTRLNLRGRGYIYIYCNRHGLMRKKI